MEIRPNGRFPRPAGSTTTTWRGSGAWLTTRLVSRAPPPGGPGRTREGAWRAAAPRPIMPVGRCSWRLEALDSEQGQLPGQRRPSGRARLEHREHWSAEPWLAARSKNAAELFTI